ncbi:hypothetical protein K466DRAFT_597544 [Polyporus arcularius HHB13444]|uniref:Fungal-type protein kinase domain-containing protein n=1 Tax=Polyporus arcularius HHB13444 TaxID=1314778 RepID=A0A5C3PLC9_9APHY|nr:hypothetical protein K466DRAFT_597544 [Polyporus arcularius HHB13444]
MPVEEFFRQFLALPQSQQSKEEFAPSSRGAFNRVPSDAATAAEIYQPMVAALNYRTKHKSRCPGLVFQVTAPSPYPRKLADMEPHICCYTVANREAPGLRSRHHLGYAELFIEVKSSPSHDYFVDPPADATQQVRASHEFLAQTQDDAFARRRDRALGQHVSYVTEIFARQYRVFVFSISMSGSRARLFRWDRAGCIVTESFDVRAQPDLMCDFLWRFSKVSASARGHDPTVGVASKKEEALFHASIRTYVETQLQLSDGAELAEAVTEHYVPGHVSAIHVLAQGSAQEVHRILVSRPVVSPLNLTGRCTRGFWGIDASSGRVVFLKDTWRSYSGRQEGVVIRELDVQGVRNVPLVLVHGDVPDSIPAEERTLLEHEFQLTVTDEYRLDPWTCKLDGQPMDAAKYGHYRLVLGTVGYGLKRLKGTEELLHACLDVFHAMKDALDKGSRLHRDISIGNIILVREPDRRIRRGYLVDWETSCEVDEAGQSLEPGRAGTWLFMSWNMLVHTGPKTQQTLRDDMESLLYVVLYCSLLWLPHSLSKESLADIIYAMFEAHTTYGDIQAGGDGKIINAHHRSYTDRIKFAPALNEWLNTVMDYNLPREIEDEDEDEDEAEVSVNVANEEQWVDRWADPTHLETFWAEFLRTHTLPSDDRLIHDHPHALGIYTPRPNPWTIVFRSTEAISLGKRPSDEVSATRVTRKRPRPDLSLTPPVAPPSRRSERIRDLQAGGREAVPTTSSSLSV